jgi:phosphoglucosamine mutase
MGADVFLVGPMPTPAVAHLTRSLVADASIVLTASHNPAEDNGIKFFSNKGIKLPDDVELKIEELIFSKKLDTSHVMGDMIGKAKRIEDASGRYIEFAKQTILNYSLSGMKIVLDCANGAAYKIAPQVFKELGAEVITIGNDPDGLNINKDCGAMCTQEISKIVKKSKADLGMAFDGDADRIILVDEKGNVVDGDSIIFLVAKNHQKRGKLKNDTVVVTQYSNLGLDAKLKDYGINTVRVENGDRYVIDEMLKSGYVVGGEKSGHIILSRYNTTGDGIVTGLHIAKINKKSGKTISELVKEIEYYPQLLKNIDIKEKKELSKIKGYKELKKKIDDKLGKDGRIFVRYSGTQNVCRVMIEGKDKKVIKAFLDEMVKLIKNEVGI